MVPGADSRAQALCVLTLAALVATSAAAQDRAYEGRVIAVKDGDSIEVLVDETPLEVRLYGIDAPERAQPWSARSKQALSGLIFGKRVRVLVVDVDRYQRDVGKVFFEDVCVSCEMVRGGHAWVYRKYTDDPVLLQLEADARSARVGLWGLPESEHVPPWDWRRGKRSEPRARPTEPSHTCGAKTYCGEMADCDEAYFHLEQCGLTRLDGDSDGVPCEQLCGRN
jgi:endonuclease YncB( thermonuclease family)